MTDRRRLVLADARRRYADGQRLGLGWTWAQCLRTAAQADKVRRNFAGALDNGIRVKPMIETETTAATMAASTALLVRSIIREARFCKKTCRYLSPKP
jgi:hypothetical protein